MTYVAYGLPNVVSEVRSRFAPRQLPCCRVTLLCLDLGGDGKFHFKGVLFDRAGRLVLTSPIVRPRCPYNRPRCPYNIPSRSSDPMVEYAQRGHHSEPISPQLQSVRVIASTIRPILILCLGYRYMKSGMYVHRFGLYLTPCRILVSFWLGLMGGQRPINLVRSMLRLWLSEERGGLLW